MDDFQDCAKMVFLGWGLVCGVEGYMDDCSRWFCWVGRGGGGAWLENRNGHHQLTLVGGF